MPHQQQVSHFVAYKQVFKTETGLEADKNLPMYLEYVKAKAALSLASSTENISIVLQRIEAKIKLVP